MCTSCLKKTNNIATKLIFLLSILSTVSCKNPQEKPHVFVILVDDMGFNDVSFRGSNQFFTPNFDALGYNGIILNNFYVPALCTPSRSSLMTGKYPSSNGMQHLVIDSDEPRGLPLEEKIMPQYFQDAGYSTSLFGKWHLGFHRRSYLPTNRGFEHVFGYRGPYVDYWNHTLKMFNRNYSAGYDMWENERPAFECRGNYSTILITDKAIEYVEQYNLDQPMFMYLAHEAPHTGNENDPMQAPLEVIDRFTYIQDPKRRVMAAMMTVVDEQIGRFVSALDRKGILENSVILLYSDNGAPTVGYHSNKGSNHPLKGQKHSAWEGAVRSSGVLWSPKLKSRNRVSEQLIHVSDWLSTLAHVAGFDIMASVNLDGYDMWQILSDNLPSPRVEVVNNIDPIVPYTSYLHSQWKYVNGTVNPIYDTWLGEIATDENPNADNYTVELFASPAWRALQRFNVPDLSQKRVLEMRKGSQVKCGSPPVEYQFNPCDPLNAPCLFDIHADPCEQFNLANNRPDVLWEMERLVKVAKQRMVYPHNVPLDPNCDPVLNNNQWTFWTDLMEERVTGGARSSMG